MNALTSGDLRPPAGEYDELLRQLTALRAAVVRGAAEHAEALSAIHPAWRASAENLLHYLALRREDLRELQARLAACGLSSLGRAEAHVLAALDTVLGLLQRVTAAPCAASPTPAPAPRALNFESGPRLLAEHAQALLGAPPRGGGGRIMVTMPSEAATDYPFVRDLLAVGMNCMRINCAHDDATAWAAMIAHLRRAEQETQLSCRILMDLAGPKLRTGPVAPGPAVRKIRPQRDALGRVIRLARVWLAPAEASAPAPSEADAALPLPRSWLGELAAGEQLSFTDARLRSRKFTVAQCTPGGVWVESDRTAYVVPGTVLHRTPSSGGGPRPSATVGEFPPAPGVIRLQRGDRLVVLPGTAPGQPAGGGEHGGVRSPATISCPIPEIFADVRAGEKIWFDDGKIGGVILEAAPRRLLVEITRTLAGGANLRADKGINLPDTVLRLPALSARDRADLAFVARHADIAALSFVNHADDVRALREQLAPAGERAPAIVLKIETRRGFENLPALLLEALRAPCCGVMIARGDLAIECGFERLAEVQEEILWVCEAAHVPVIWATQVLETLAREGLPSRAEITDAAMGHRAECVMLNKGPHILAAVRALGDILRRMEGHQSKKRAMLRRLHLAHVFHARACRGADGKTHPPEGK